MEPFNLEKFKAGQQALTRDGRKATFIGICERCVDINKLVVHTEGARITDNYCIDGFYYEDNIKHHSDLISMVSPYADWPIDAKVMCTVYQECEPRWPAHFAGVDSCGDPLIWQKGTTSHTTIYPKLNVAHIELVKE